MMDTTFGLRCIACKKRISLTETIAFLPDGVYHERCEKKKDPQWELDFSSSPSSSSSSSQETRDE